MGSGPVERTPGSRSRAQLDASGEDTPMTRSVDRAIARLRKKIECDPPNPDYIRTAHAGEYCLTFSPESSMAGT